MTSHSNVHVQVNVYLNLPNNLRVTIQLTCSTSVTLVPISTSTGESIHLVSTTSSIQTWIRRAVINIISTQCAFISRITDADESIYLILTSSSRGTWVCSTVIGICKQINLNGQELLAFIFGNYIHVAYCICAWMSKYIPSLIQAILCCLSFFAHVCQNS